MVETSLGGKSSSRAALASEILTVSVLKWRQALKGHEAVVEEAVVEEAVVEEAVAEEAVAEQAVVEEAVVVEGV